MRTGFILTCLLCLNQSQAQETNRAQDSTRLIYLNELKRIGKEFAGDFYPNYSQFYLLPENNFITKIDSVRNIFNNLLASYKSKFDISYFLEQQAEIKYYFDKLLLDYPLNHDNYIGQTSASISTIPQKLTDNLPDFNEPGLLTNSDFTNYVKSFFAYQIHYELKKTIYTNSDNQQLEAVWKLIPRFVSNPTCITFWQFHYLYNHIENNGIKNIKAVYDNFTSTCTDTAYLNKIYSVYYNESNGRQRHVIKTYKTVGPFTLDLHVFLPDDIKKGPARPSIVFFHGGSWSEGKPDWFFDACESYTKKGWVAFAVEYRTYGRHGTLPFDAVMDAKSAVRWVRQHAHELNIDTGKIVASGNSAGGHLVLCAALADKWNERSDDLTFSPVPNVLLINSGVYDLTDVNNAWISKDLKDKNLVKEISPNYLIQKNLPPTLIIHGTNDQNVSYSTAETFVTEMKKVGNRMIDFKTLHGAEHFIWYSPIYSHSVLNLRNEFLNKMGY